MTFSPVQKVSAYESIVDQVEQAVDRGELRAGDRLPGERQMMTDFGVSRAVVREALRVLQATGLVESRPGDPRGPVITAYSPRMLEKSLSRLAHLETISRVELLQFRLLLEGRSCLLAAINHTPADLQRIEAGLAALERVMIEDAGGFGDAVNHFHAVIRRASGNQLLEVCGNVVGGIMAQVADRRLSVIEDRRLRMERSVTDAKILLDAIRRREAKEAEAISVRNIHRFYADDLSPDEALALAPFVADEVLSVTDEA